MDFKISYWLLIAMFSLVVLLQLESVLTEYIGGKRKLYKKLFKELSNNTQKWGMTIGEDLSITFDDSSRLFEHSQWELTPEFKGILDEFFPKFLGILQDDKFLQHIKEIRIESRIDNVACSQLDTDLDITNIILSQKRVLNILKYLYSKSSYASSPKKVQKMFENRTICNGFSYGRLLANTEYISSSEEGDNLRDSNQIELRIVTDADEILESSVKKFGLDIIDMKEQSWAVISLAALFVVVVAVICLIIFLL